MKKVIVVEEEDNVATAVAELKEGDTLDIEKIGKEITVIEDIPFGHKVAIEEIDEGENIIKYGLKIGEGQADIQTGDHVHRHNVKDTYKPP